MQKKNLQQQNKDISLLIIKHKLHTNQLSQQNYVVYNIHIHVQYI